MVTLPALLFSFLCFGSRSNAMRTYQTAGNGFPSMFLRRGAIRYQRCAQSIALLF